MKRLLLFVCISIYALSGYGQTTGSFVVNGDFDKFYPVTFVDGGWISNMATELEIGRSDVHTDAQWRGSLNALFRFHTFNWGNASHFIDADVKQFNASSSNTLIAGWQDVTAANADRKIIIWLRGGVTTYFYKSNYSVNPIVYDGVQNPLPYQQTGGPTHTYKTALEPYVNNKGLSFNRSAYFNGIELNYFGGTVGIGTRTPNATLGVNGNIRAKEIKVETANWPDYVFTPSYNLPSLQETEQHIKEKGHLPGIPSAEEVKNNGVDLGEMNAKLLQKIEELTLHLIRLEKENEEIKKANESTNAELAEIKKILKKN